VKEVREPGTITEIQPPLPSACVLEKALFKKEKGRLVLVMVDEEILIDQPLPPELPASNED